MPVPVPTQREQLPQWDDGGLHEAENLRRWHIYYFRTLGFERHQAEILELAAVRPHDLEDLLKAGCPREIELLIEILS